MSFPMLPENIIREIIDRVPCEDATSLFDKFYHSLSANIREKYFGVSGDDLFRLCGETLDQSSEQWKDERRKRITGLS